LVGFLAENPEAVDKATCYEFVYPCSFVWQESRDTILPFWVVDVYGFVADVVVARENDVWMGNSVLFYEIENNIEVSFFDLLSDVAGGTRGEI
jgi:hypothetical protein